MTAIAITPMEPGHYGVQVGEGDLTTSHRVAVTEAFVDDLQLQDVQPERLVEETLLFLLDRTPATSVPPEFSVDEVGRMYPEFYDELRARLAA